MTEKIRGVVTGKNEEFVFEYSTVYNTHLKSNVYVFQIWNDRELSLELHRYSLILEILHNGDLKVIDLFAGDYAGKGISIPMILKAKQLFGKRIISSSNRFKSSHTEGNWVDAINKVWNPMVNQGLAKYDEKRDYYYTT